MSKSVSIIFTNNLYDEMPGMGGGMKEVSLKSSPWRGFKMLLKSPLQREI